MGGQRPILTCWRASARDCPGWPLIMASVTLLLLFLAFGSVLLPVKAVLMNLVSIAASFGVVVWIFQDGHLAVGSVSPRPASSSRVTRF